MASLQQLAVREYATLKVSEGSSVEQRQSSLDKAYIPQSAFDWLIKEAALDRKDAPKKGAASAALLTITGKDTLQLCNYVGVLETPCGLQLEILPKHVDAAPLGGRDATEDAKKDSRRMLQRMICTLLAVRPRESAEADLMTSNIPLPEWVAQQFLEKLTHLMQRGLRSDYRRVEDEQLYLRGRLDVQRQMRQPPGRDHWFQICHDVYTPDRAENRLLKAAILRVLTATQSSDNWRLANELAHRLVDVPASKDQAADWRSWQKNRLMAPYQEIRPWCELVLGQDMPHALKGNSRGLSFLFPMEKLFETYVAKKLGDKLPEGMRLRSQERVGFLCQQEGAGKFGLKPDLLLLKDPSGPAVAVLDAKWKRLEGKDPTPLPADAYQLLAYGIGCLGGSGTLALIYPKTRDFATPPAAYKFPKATGLSLWVLPFDMENGCLVPPIDNEEPLGLPFEWT